MISQEATKKNLGLRIAAAIFGIMAAVHFVRLIVGWDVVIGGLNIPLWVSGIAIAVLGTLSVWLLRLSREQSY